MPNKIKIHKSEETDAADVLRLQYAAYQSEAELNNDFTIQPLTQTVDELLTEYRKGIVTDNIGLWIPIGLGLGLALGASLPLAKDKKP